MSVNPIHARTVADVSTKAVVTTVSVKEVILDLHVELMPVNPIHARTVADVSTKAVVTTVSAKEVILDLHLMSVNQIHARTVADVSTKAVVTTVSVKEVILDLHVELMPVNPIHARTVADVSTKAVVTTVSVKEVILDLNVELMPVNPIHARTVADVSTKAVVTTVSVKEVILDLNVEINQTHVTQNLAKTEENVVIMGKLIPVNVLTDIVEDIVLLKHASKEVFKFKHLYQDKPDPCASKPCKNRGKCTVKGTGYVCTCAKGYSGRYCALKSPPSYNDDDEY
ncbi:Adhesive plaque matrix protein 2,Neurogenic locus notch homolog protein 2 [Mytilus edulis]|uniref:Adhesive plaque matrix protein 2,Neurogenic locus notch homolog protein 2 n=1 Tax=Mytilus edulis TaxID=6550 RepID=A0A8S3S343_MYTED|nr:Adhesive plaque matrix protein 2,Neurogenic locus notch homolog protein 2 [Mytilus edulis]